LSSVAFEGYDIVGKLGAGGLADVFEAVVEGIEGSVALKVLREAERGEAFVKRFLREGRLLQRLQHPGLPRCHRVSGEGSRPHILLEVLRGETLSERVRESGPIPPEEVLTIASSLLDVLDFLHGHGVVHRDVKSGNVFLENTGRVVLMDLGLAGDPVDPLTTTLGDVMGTFAYMAPEQLAGAQMDHRADLYSLGVTLFEAVVGKRPFGARGAAGTLQAQRKQGSALITEAVPGGTPGNLVELITRLLTWDPRGRPSSARVASAILMGREGLTQDLVEPPLVGRHGAMGAVEATLDGGGCIQLVGEPGSGAGRLARTLWQQARSRSMEVLGVRCRERAPDDDPVDQLAHHLQLILGRSLESPADIAEALADLVGEGPLLLVVEDIEQAHASAVEALAELFALPGLRVVVTGLRPALPFPGRVVALRPLELEEVRVLVAGMLRGGTPPSGLSEELHRVTGGLPAAVAAGVRELHRREVLCFDGLDEMGELSWRLDGAISFGAPGPMEDLFSQTLDALSDGARKLLGVLAVSGESLPLEVATEVAGLAPGALEPFELVGRKLVDETRDAKGDWLILRRPIIGTLVLAGLDQGARREVHAGIAACMEGSEEETWKGFRLAYHQAHSSQPAEAPRALVSLGEWLVAKGHYVRALGILEEVIQDENLDPLTATHAALARGSALLGLARPIEGAESLQAARQLAEEQGRGDLVAGALLELGEARRRYGSSKRAAHAAEEAISRLSGPLYEKLSAQAQLLRGTALTARGEYGSAKVCLEGALSMAVRQPRIKARVEGALGRLALELGNVVEGVTWLESQISSMEQQGDPELLVEAWYHMSLAHLGQGRIGDASRAAGKADSVLRQARLARLAVVPNVARAAVLLACRDLVQADRCMGQAREIEHAPSRVRLDWWGLRAELRQLEGDRPAALAAHHRAVEESERAGWLVRRAFHEAMEAVLTGRGQALQKALGTLTQRGAAHFTARVLLMGVEVGGDTEVLAAAVRSARKSGDQLLLLQVLQATGGDAARAEGLILAEHLLASAPGDYATALGRSNMVRWAREG
jgi:tetratricopeptide (TPR) repeat protein